MPPDRYERPDPLKQLFARVDALADTTGDRLLATFEATERLSERQAREIWDLVWSEGAPLRCGLLGFSARECDILTVLSARLNHPLVWQHVVITVDGVTMGDGRYVEEGETVE